MNIGRRAIDFGATLQILFPMWIALIGLILS